MRPSFPALRSISLDTCHLPMKYESVASNRKSPGSQMLRRLVSKFNVELPEGLQITSTKPFKGDVQHVMDGREVYLYDHLRMTIASTGRDEAGHRRCEKLKGMGGPCFMDPRPRRCGHLVSARAGKQEFQKRQVQAKDSHGGGDIPAFSVASETTPGYGRPHRSVNGGGNVRQRGSCSGRCAMCPCRPSV